jgi:hypothetical protein
MFEYKQIYKSLIFTKMDSHLRGNDKNHCIKITKMDSRIHGSDGEQCHSQDQTTNKSFMQEFYSFVIPSPLPRHSRVGGNPKRIKTKQKNL